MDFIRKNIMTSVCVGLGLISLLFSIDSLAPLFFGGAITSFLFESGMAPELSNKLRKLLKL